MDNERSKSSAFNHFIIVSPFLGYVVAYYYELGFSHVIGIPGDWIEVEIKAIITAAANVFFFGLFALQMSTFFLLPTSEFTRAKPHALAWRIRFFVLILFLNGIYFFLLPDLLTKLIGWIVPGLLFLMVIFLEFVLPLITEGKQKTYIAKLEEQDKTDDQYPSVLTKFQRSHPLIFGFIFFALICTASSYALGRRSAINRTDFYVLVNAPEKIVLRKYSDTLILVPFTRDPLKIAGPIEITSMALECALQVRKEKLGRLFKP